MIILQVVGVVVITVLAIIGLAAVIGGLVAAWDSGDDE
jgi:hypothetical protein